nr:KUP/HAK/KT family potassium transporter [uncultured Flavobacterium sp.]
MFHGNSATNRVTVASLLLTLGIIYGDIGTSPLYVMKAIIGKTPINENIVLGALSCIFWTITLQTTLKYVIITLQADNNGEGGIFSLYTLVKKLKKRWLILPAIIGGSALLADGIITPPISVSSAIEGLRVYNPEINTIAIVISILFFLFFIQQFGTHFIGKFFGPAMLIWFIMIGVLGTIQITQNPTIFKAINPYYAYLLLQQHHEGFYVLGFVFLCTTGAEALYSDLGHCGIKNIRMSWIFVKLMLLLNYFGQGAYLTSITGSTLPTVNQTSTDLMNPFFAIMPSWFVPIGIGVATMAAVIASQALISGSFTLISEAIRLNLWPRIKVAYPSIHKGQLYIPSINWMMFLGCVAIVLYFQESENMEAAYGLAIVLCMLMTTTLLIYYMFLKRFNIYVIVGLSVLFYSIELSFFIANISKFTEGGFVTLTLAILLASVMVIWYQSKKITKNYTEYIPIASHQHVLSDLSKDTTLTKYASHLVYLTSSTNSKFIEHRIIQSIIYKRPKRADVYWLLHVHVTDNPYDKKYKVTTICKDCYYRIDFYLGFKVPQKIDLFFRNVVQNMVNEKQIDITSQYPSLNKHNITADFKFVIQEKYLSNVSNLPWYEKIILDSYYFIKKWGINEEKIFGLDTASVKTEKFPITIRPITNINLTKINDE